MSYGARRTSLSPPVPVMGAPSSASSSSYMIVNGVDQRASTTMLSTPVSSGRYVLHAPIARGGMATVHIARFVAAEGVTRLVAAKRLHPQFTDDPEFVAMFHDEARIASRIHHPNVVPVLDVIMDGEEVILVQEYVHGVPLSHLFKLAHHGPPTPIAVGAAIVAGVLAGLQAAHEATDELGEPLGVVHRDVSPQNIIVSVDGTPRLLDFGIAKAKTSVHHTREGFFKGKLSYMSPEQLRAEPITRRVDLYAAGVLLWEMLVNRRFYDGKNDADFVRTIAIGSTPTPTAALESQRHAVGIPRWADIERLEPIVMRALSADPDDRYGTATEMAAAIFAAVRVAPATEVSTYVRALGSEYLDKRQKVLIANEESWRRTLAPKVDPWTSIDESVKSSRARMRAAAAAAAAEDEASNNNNNNNNDERPTEPAPCDPRSASTGGLHQYGALSALTTLAASSSHTGLIEKERSLVPWTVVAALLVIVGLLTGMVLVREVPTTTSSAPANASQPPPPTTSLTQTAPNTAQTSLPEQETSAPVPPRPAPSTVMTIVRYVAPPKVQPSRTPPTTPASTPTPPSPAPPSATRVVMDNCNPPFFFEGTKKVFKPSCL